ncbi:MULTISPECIES: uroporphyrinogen-III synthase [Rothia]|uniref:Uroporphyrinogen-III synthase n=1 Tax=Rothia amarae TaxID=169480 RepID=A0A7H2BJN5_9MICC|nr:MULTISPECIES: uroporphyrinogen-III synthase [Rothia]QNV39881.1 uroporphyrinogen-III synthase [Rothia amarae]SIK65444.1 Possible transcriptional regulatory protein [Mycobacteroides abscessus subsp. abscessus]
MNDQLLADKTIAITASRRAEEQAGAFERHGARVLLAPTVRIVKTDDDAALAAETQQVLAHPPHVLLVATGHGLKSWLDATEKNGGAERLKEMLSDAQIYVRGAKGRGAVRSLGWQDSGIAQVETTESLVELALEKGVAGKNVTIQQHGKPDPALVKRLEDAGATVTQVHPNRWEEPENPALVDELINRLIAGEIDAITFTAAPAVEALLEKAYHLGRGDEVEAALRTETVVAVVGPVTAEPLNAIGVNPVCPERFRMGAMVKDLIEALQ